ncbi:MAG: asparagine synthetase B, partial [Firmicutes bacterium]|nr:asparagine synthetase B [Bacillota bacterium]
MCGIVGIWRKDRPVAAEELRGMLNTLVHRGPDGEGHFTDRGIGLGMRRLAVIDIQLGQQPYYSEDRSVVAVFNGELYNYPELKHLVEA